MLSCTMSDIMGMYQHPGWSAPMLSSKNGFLCRQVSCIVCFLYWQESYVSKVSFIEGDLVFVGSAARHHPAQKVTFANPN